MAETYNNRGIALNGLKRHEEALQNCDKAIALKPGLAQAYNNRGIALNDLKRHEDALRSYDKAIALKPDYAEAYSNRGIALNGLKRHEEALQSCDKAIALKPDVAETYNNRGNSLNGLKRHEEALEGYDKAIALKPGYVEAYNNRGNALTELKRHEEALQSCDKAIALKPDYAEAYSNRGIALSKLERYEEAVQSCDRAIALKPDYAEAYRNRGIALTELKRHEEALQSYDRAISLKPDQGFLYGDWLYARMYICDWRDAGQAFSRLSELIERGDRASSPFPFLAISNSSALQRKMAELYVREKYPAAASPAVVAAAPGHDKIRIGYFSADFHNHATAFLIAELFERHDRTRFEVHAFSFGPRTNDEMRQRLTAAVDSFIDVRAQSDVEVATLARSLGIDIAIDLKGLTKEHRLGVFAQRAAPIQVNYLGYPGTLGADYIDYLIADPTLIPETDQQHYSEKIVYLPDSYQVSNLKRQISDRTFTREELGLPPSGVVFCCFNNNYKILPDTFDGWMRILRQVEGSVLWLLQDNEAAARNLRKEAAGRGIAADRLIFATRLPLADHLARHRLADLFLDTLPYNAHTTASDALWAGLPVLTRIGETFAGRVSPSLLNAIHLPELITSTQADYEKLAVELAINPGRLLQIRRKLERNRLTTPLFDTALFTRHIEEAYAMIHERHLAGLTPTHLWSA